MFFPCARATILVPTPSNGKPDLKHLYVLLTDPQGGNQDTLIVSISSIKQHLPCDRTCMLFPGDHPFIKKRSYVRYDRSRIISAQSLINGVNQGELIPKDPMDAGIVARICNGLTDSRHTPLNIKNFYLRAT